MTEPNEPGAARRLGVIGSGRVARGLVERAAASPKTFELAFVHARNRPSERLGHEGTFIADLGDASTRSPTLVVEAAHPSYTVERGDQVLAICDYLPLSLTALADDDVYARLQTVAAESGHRLWIPHGAMVGVDSLVESAARWRDVTVTFEKHPASLDFMAAPQLDPGPDAGRTTVFDGSVREIAGLFPRNVNAMVAAGLATVGLDQCRAVLVSDPALDHGVLDLRAAGRDGSVLQVRREQPMSGVSGTEMLDATWGSVVRAARADGTHAFC